jgi:hypothetical protein
MSLDLLISDIISFKKNIDLFRSLHNSFFFVIKIRCDVINRAIVLVINNACFSPFIVAVIRFRICKILNCWLRCTGNFSWLVEEQLVKAVVPLWLRHAQVVGLGDLFLDRTCLFLGRAWLFLGRWFSGGCFLCQLTRSRRFGLCLCFLRLRPGKRGASNDWMQLVVDVPQNQLCLIPTQLLDAKFVQLFL